MLGGPTLHQRYKQEPNGWPLHQAAACRRSDDKSRAELSGKAQLFRYRDGEKIIQGKLWFNGDLIGKMVIKWWSN